jgi:hypothetical protein
MLGAMVATAVTQAFITLQNFSKSPSVNPKAAYYSY